MNLRPRTRGRAAYRTESDTGGGTGEIILRPVKRRGIILPGPPRWHPAFVNLISYLSSACCLLSVKQGAIFLGFLACHEGIFYLNAKI